MFQIIIGLTENVSIDWITTVLPHLFSLVVERHVFFLHQDPHPGLQSQDCHQKQQFSLRPPLPSGQADQERHEGCED